MQTAHGVARQALSSSTKPQPAPSPRSALPDEHRQAIKQLFARMKGAYGHVWSSRFTTPEALAVAMTDWAKQLLGSTPAQIDQAIDEALARHRLPPTLPEFVAILRPEVAPYHKPAPKALPAPTNRELALQTLAQLKQLYPKRQPAEAADAGPG